MHWIHDTPLAGLDCETTGLDPARDLPVSCAVTLHHGPSLDSPHGFPLLIDPGVTVPPSSITVHGITTDHVRAWGSPLPRALEAVNAQLMSALRDGRALVAANARYDLTLLDNASRSAGVEPLHARAAREGLPVHVLDPLLIDRWWDRYRPGERNLGALCRRYGVRLDEPHRAQADAVAAVELLRALMDLVYDEDGALGRLGSGHWEGVRWLELRACASAADLHALLGRWAADHGRARQAWKRRTDPEHVEPRGWPLMTKRASPA